MDNFKFPEPGDSLSTADDSSEVIDINFEEYFSKELENNDLDLNNLDIQSEEIISPNIIDFSQNGAESLIGDYEEDEVTTANIDDYILNNIRTGEPTSTATPELTRPKVQSVQEKIINGPQQVNTNNINKTPSATDNVLPASTEDTDVSMPKNLKYIIYGVVCVCVLLVIFKSWGSVDLGFNLGSSSKDTVATVPNEVRYSIAEVVCSTETYVDYLIIKKEVSVTSEHFEAKLCGSTTKNNVAISIPLATSEYNKYVDGQILQVAYNLVKVNDEVFACNVMIEGVIAE